MTYGGIEICISLQCIIIINPIKLAYNPRRRPYDGPI